MTHELVYALICHMIYAFQKDATIYGVGYKQMNLLFLYRTSMRHLDYFEKS